VFAFVHLIQEVEDLVVKNLDVKLMGGRAGAGVEEKKSDKTTNSQQPVVRLIVGTTNIFLCLTSLIYSIRCKL
jgi:hypothetical protein